MCFVGSFGLSPGERYKGQGSQGRGGGGGINEIEEPDIILGQIHHRNSIRVLVVFYTRRILGEIKIKSYIRG